MEETFNLDILKKLGNYHKKLMEELDKLNNNFEEKQNGE